MEDFDRGGAAQNVVKYACLVLTAHAVRSNHDLLCKMDRLNEVNRDKLKRKTS